MTLDNYDSKIKNIETITEKLLGDKLSVYFFNELKLRHSSEIYYTLCEKLEYILYAQIDEKNKYNNINLNIIFEIHKLYNTNNQMRELFIFYQFDYNNIYNHQIKLPIQNNDDKYIKNINMFLLAINHYLYACYLRKLVNSNINNFNTFNNNNNVEFQS